MTRKLAKAVAALALLLSMGCGLSAAPVAPSRRPGQSPDLSVPATTALSTAPAPPAAVAEEIRDQIIVKYNTPSTLSTKGFRFPKSQVVDSYDAGTPTQLHRLPKGVSQAQALASYRQDATVEYAEPNIRFRVNALPNDPLIDQQWALPLIHAERAWELAASAPPITVGVIDTGVDYTHPDLAERIVKGPNYIDNNYDPRDGYGHGTHVAGIIAALTNNGAGMAGLATNAKIMAIKALDDKGYGDIFTVAKAIVYAAQHNVKIVNISLGSPGKSSFTMSFVGWYAARIRGCLLIAAAGNAKGPVEIPARLSDYFMAVGATDGDDHVAPFSNRGPELSVVAPGVKILSTLPTYTVTMNREFNYPLNYGALDGTSMATPFVAAAAAVIWARHPDWDYRKVRQGIESSAVQRGASAHNADMGYGRIDFARVP